MLMKFILLSILLFTAVYSQEPKMNQKIFSMNFEVFGIVQGVFFRKYTQKQAKSLGLVGWCMNTHSGTVKGNCEGPEGPINEMKHWLKTTGSPSSKIDKAEFSDMIEIKEYTTKSFEIRQ